MNTKTEIKIRLHDINGDLIDPAHCITCERILDNNIKNFVLAACDRYGRGNKMKEADAVGQILYELLTDKGFAGEGIKHQVFVDVLLGAAMVHNMFYDDEHISTLYLTREKLSELAGTMNPIAHELQDAIYQAIEAQDGDLSVVLGSKPSPNSPPELMAQAKLIYNYMKYYTLD